MMNVCGAIVVIMRRRGQVGVCKGGPGIPNIPNSNLAMNIPISQFERGNIPISQEKLPISQYPNVASTPLLVVQLNAACTLLKVQSPHMNAILSIHGIFLSSFFFFESGQELYFSCRYIPCQILQISIGEPFLWDQ